MQLKLYDEGIHSTTNFQAPAKYSKCRKNGKYVALKLTFVSLIVRSLYRKQPTLLAVGKINKIEYEL